MQTDFILTSSEICHIALSINARESALMADFIVREYKLYKVDFRHRREKITGLEVYFGAPAYGLMLGVRR